MYVSMAAGLPGSPRFTDIVEDELEVFDFFIEVLVYVVPNIR